MTNTDSVKAHMNKAHLDIQAAKLLHGNGFFSHSIACSYYAVFHAIEAVLLADEISVSSHRQSLGMFNKNYVHLGTISSFVSQVAYELFEKRNTLEYDPRELMGEEGSQVGIDKATQAVNEIVDYFKSHGIHFEPAG